MKKKFNSKFLVVFWGIFFILLFPSKIFSQEKISSESLDSCDKSGGKRVSWSDSHGQYSRCECPEGYINEGESCAPKRPVNEEGSSSCKIDMVNLGEKFGLADKCFEVETLEKNCKSSGGEWFKNRDSHSSQVDEGQAHSSILCNTSNKAIFNELNREEYYDPNDNNLVHVKAIGLIREHFYSCECPGNQCIDEFGKCVDSKNYFSSASLFIRVLPTRFLEFFYTSLKNIFD